MKHIFIGIIRLYQLTISKILPPCCRFYPSCSQYGITALNRFGAVRGGCLTIRRIARCNPFSAGGYDPVPEEFHFFGTRRRSAGNIRATRSGRGAADSIKTKEG